MAFDPKSVPKKGILFWSLHVVISAAASAIACFVLSRQDIDTWVSIWSYCVIAGYMLHWMASHLSGYAVFQRLPDIEARGTTFQHDHAVVSDPASDPAARSASMQSISRWEQDAKFAFSAARHVALVIVGGVYLGCVTSAWFLYRDRAPFSLSLAVGVALIFPVLHFFATSNPFAMAVTLARRSRRKPE